MSFPYMSDVSPSAELFQPFRLSSHRSILFGNTVHVLQGTRRT
jgi:hypothetical protein